LRPARPDEVLRGFAEVFELFRQGETLQPYRVLAALYGIVDACRKPAAADDSPRDRRQGLVARAEALAASGRPGGLNVSELAAALQVSRTTLFTVFRDVLGITPIEFLTRKRLERAKDLMRRTRRPLRVIARMSGFGEPKYFLRRFKQCEGMTPTEWQRRNAGEETSP
jgi:AraC-like DNA-binding protein